MIFNVTGGGGTSLNFKVVGGTTAPENPKENTIWVNTDVTIPSWIFSAEEPSPAEAGMVWISVGTSSSVVFNALKKNDIQVYPLSAKQYVGDQWVDVEAKTYQGGQWVEWANYLYASGDECTGNGGNWVCVAVGMNSDSPSAQNPVFTNGTSQAVITQVSGKGGIVRKENKIDLTDATQLVLTGSLDGTGGDHHVAIGVWSAAPATYWGTNRVAKSDFGTQSGEISVTLDVSSLSGSYYVGLCIYGARTLTMDKLEVVG